MDDRASALARLDDPLKRDGMILRHVRAHDQDRVGVHRDRLAPSVAPPRPNVVPRPGTVELCHIRAWLLMQTMPSPAANSFLIR